MSRWTFPFIVLFVHFFSFNIMCVFSTSRWAAAACFRLSFRLFPFPSSQLTFILLWYIPFLCAALTLCQLLSFTKAPLTRCCLALVAHKMRLQRVLCITTVVCSLHTRTKQQYKFMPSLSPILGKFQIHKFHNTYNFSMDYLLHTHKLPAVVVPTDWQISLLGKSLTIFSILIPRKHTAHRKASKMLALILTCLRSWWVTVGRAMSWPNLLVEIYFVCLAR